MKRLKKGFTLIELLVVIAIIGILATTLAPKLREQLAKAKDSKAIALLGATRTAANVILTERMVQDSTDAITVADLKLKLDDRAGTLLALGNNINVGGTRPTDAGAVAYGGTVEILSASGSSIDTNIVITAGEINLTLESTTAIDLYSTENKLWNLY